ncbi:type-F conjugative transfer system protein TrbI [Mangrovibacter phragmitis]|uniref:type-F conjugative transfer system protein TrbI n=1 Tax=Mangrovibacter phragmitis TaxID=1691903 RepID=UPI0035125E62
MTLKDDEKPTPPADITVPAAGNVPGNASGLPGWVRWLTGGLTLLLLMVCVSLATVRMTTPDVVAFDMKGTIDLFMQQMMQQKLDAARVRHQTARFNDAMTASLTAWQDGHHAIILVAPAVVSDVPDITSAIRTDIAQRMQAPAR